MATTLTLNSLVSFYGTYGTDSDIEDAVASIFPKYLQAYSDGTGPSQANTWYAETVALTGSATTFDITGGITDRFGNVITMTSLREIAVINRSSTLFATLAGELTVSFDPLASETAVQVYPSGVFYFRAPLGLSGVTYGIPISAANDTFTLVSSGSSSEVDLILVGTR